MTPEAIQAILLGLKLIDELAMEYKRRYIEQLDYTAEEKAKLLEYLNTERES